MSNYWGYHLMVNISGGNESIKDAVAITEFSKELVKEIDMVAYGEPRVVHFAAHDPDKAGYTLDQLIETSNIMAHFCDKDGSAYFDIFSCKNFDVDSAMDVIQKYFEPSKMTFMFVLRDAKYSKDGIVIVDGNYFDDDGTDEYKSENVFVKIWNFFRGT